MKEPLFVLEVEAIGAGGVPVEVRLRRAVKALARAYGLRVRRARRVEGVAQSAGEPCAAAGMEER